MRLEEHFRGAESVFSAGWGTLLTNDFRGCHPRGEDTLEPLSLVCKLTSADGVGCVKLSDNARKAVGERALVERYRQVFGTEAEVGAVVVV